MREKGWMNLDGTCINADAQEWKGEGYIVEAKENTQNE